MIFSAKSVSAIQSRNDPLYDLGWIFGEWRRYFGLSLEIFISFFTPQKDLKKLPIKIIMTCTCGKKSELLEHFWAIPFQHMYKVPPNWKTFIIAIFLIFFPQESYESLFSFHWWWSSILFYMNKGLCLFQELVMKIRAMLNPFFLYGLTL